MKIGIVILNFNGTKFLGETLDSVKKLRTNSFDIETIVVDNASTDTSFIEDIHKNYHWVHLIQNTQNLGFSEGNNVGIREALKRGAEYVLILNNDTILDSQMLTSLVSFAEKEPKGGIFGPKIYFAPGFEFHKDRYLEKQKGNVIWYAGGKIDWDNVLASHRGVDEVDEGQYDVVIKTPFVTGCALFVRREVFEKVGWFDPKLYLYYEDLDFCKRASLKGFEIYYVPQAKLWHKNAQTAGGPGSDLQSYYITRNRLLIGVRYAPWKIKLALFREASRLMIWGTLTQKQAVGDFLRKKFGKRTWVPRMINLIRGFGKSNIDNQSKFKK